MTINSFNNTIVQVKTAREIITKLEPLPINSTVFIDIDDTLITPVSKTFRREPYNKIIDEIKLNKNEYHNYTTIVSNWRLQRKVMLVDAEWPEVINNLRNKYYVYGLTKMDTGQFGNIQSMETWRYNELKIFNISFTQSALLDNHKIINKNFSNPPAFDKGIFYTGSASKGEVILLYQTVLKPSLIVLIDDRKEHLYDVQTFCKKQDIPFLGIYFKGTENLLGEPDSAIVEFQKKYLLEKAQWLEDAEAEILLDKLK